MTAVPQDTIATLSYVRQPAEEAEVLAEAAVRFGTSAEPQAGLGTRYLLIGIIGGGGISLFLHAYRSFVLLPFLGLTPLVEVSDLLAICSVPCLIIYLLFSLQIRRETRQKLAVTAARIKPDVTVSVSVSKQQGLVWGWQDASLRLGWPEISDIAMRFGRIEIDSDTTVAYIPSHAFHNQQEQTAMLARIQGFWRAAAAKP